MVLHNLGWQADGEASSDILTGLMGRQHAEHCSGHCAIIPPKFETLSNSSPLLRQTRLLACYKYTSIGIRAEWRHPDHFS